METTENWFVLFTMVTNQQRVCMALRREELNAFLPSMEYYRRDSKSIETKPMFPGYIFIREKLSQTELDRKLEKLAGRADYVRQLREEGAPSPLTSEEIEMFTQLLDEEGILRMSKAYLNLKTGKAVVTEGPLQKYQDSIVKLDKHNWLAYLELKFMDKNLQAGIEIQRNAAPISKKGKKKKNQKTPFEEKPNTAITADTAEENDTFLSELDLEELKSKMMRL